MEKQEKLAQIQSINKEEEIHALLEELLPEMGFKDVTITHERGNTNEDGKDVVCSIYDKKKKKKDWIAFVVKKGQISGKSSSIQEIIDQTKDCFEFAYKSIFKGDNIRISKVKVVCNKHFTNGAQNKILNNNNFEKPNIDFWDGEKIVSFIDKYYPKYWLKGSKKYKKYVEVLEGYIQEDSTIKALGVQNKNIQNLIKDAIELKLFELQAEDDGSYTKKYIKSSSVINIPDSSIVVGEPGSGKSTLFKTLAREVIEQNSLRNDTEYYPVIISFKDIYDAYFDLEKAIEDYFNKGLFVNNGVEIEADHLLSNENMILFIDALDEIAQVNFKEKSLKAIKKFKKNIVE